MAEKENILQACLGHIHAGLLCACDRVSVFTKLVLQFCYKIDNKFKNWSLMH